MKSMKLRSSSKLFKSKESLPQLPKTVRSVTKPRSSHPLPMSTVTSTGQSQRPKEVSLSPRKKTKRHLPPPDHTPVAAGPASGTTDSAKGHQEVTVAEVVLKVAEAKLEPTQDWYDDYEDHAHDAEEEYDTHNYYYGGKQIPLETTLSLLMLKKAIPINLYFNRRESQKQDEFEKQIALVIDQIWSQFDKDGSGQLNRKECREFFDESNRQMNGASQQITDEEFNAAFAIVDQNGSGLISKDEMKTFIKYIAGYK
ncbi:hypothetical protein FGO68_gene4179 [Halteria grandinella]|uniref:EF-hand domain-containing protein n=1 Tax=Halteria grandinella TaxID=5974 RepID=A0A8J8NQ31_HALGN|nr:hypothetical protein FGO68_gene4179 [Halteria grandinella]